MNHSSPYIRRATSDGVWLQRITPESADWTHTGVHVAQLPAGADVVLELPHDEMLVLPLRGSVDVVSAGQEQQLSGRPDPWRGTTDAWYLPPGRVSLRAPTDQACHIAIATARAGGRYPPQYLSASDVAIELRGSGACSRQVQNYTMGTTISCERLLVCEVLTPGGNWSSYPPHKHDEHSSTERELEEIYYFDIAGGNSSPGMAYHRVYGTSSRPIDVIAEVRSHDVVLVPHGYHGPTIAAPGYDLYYLNVMAGPARDHTWMSVDDPAHHWVRETWTHQAVDSRLPWTSHRDQGTS